jgi:thiol peroxidase
MAQITFQGQILHTCAELPNLGSIAPDFSLTNNQLQQVTLETYAGKRKLLQIVPSIDTPTCALSTRTFNEKAARLVDTVVLVISADLPFAQARFSEAEGLDNVVFLSTFRSSFAQDYGLSLVDSLLTGLTARAVMILAKDNSVLYTELVAELADEPNYSAALAVLNAATY